MFQSPLKTVAEKLKPTDSKSTLSSLRFERSSDFKKFITFIKDETKELEKIKIPSETEIKPKTGTSGLLGLGALGLFGLLGGAFGGGGENEENLRLGSAGQTTPIKSNLVLTKNVRKVSKNIGSSKFIGNKKGLKKAFRKLFGRTRPGKLRKIEKIAKARLTLLQTKLGEAVSRRDDIFAKRKIAKQKGQPTVILDRLLKGANKQVVQLQNFIIEDTLNFREKSLRQFSLGNVAAIKEVIKESKLTFKSGSIGKPLFGPGNFRFMAGADATSIESIQNMIASNPKKAEKFLKGVLSMDDLLFPPTKIPTFKVPFFKDIKGANLTFTPREFLDKRFTEMGKITKPLRNFFGSQLKNLGKTKIPGSRLIPFTKGIKFSTALKGIKIGLPFADVINFLSIGYDTVIAQGAPLGFVDFSDGVTKPKIGRDNILTGLYDIFTHFYNSGVEGLGFSDANKRLFISKPKDQFVTGSLIPFTNIGAYKVNPRRDVDAKNKKILDARRMRDLFNRSLGDPISGQQMDLLKSFPLPEFNSDGAEFSFGIGEPLNSFGIFTEYKLNQK